MFGDLSEDEEEFGGVVFELEDKERVARFRRKKREIRADVDFEVEYVLFDVLVMCDEIVLVMVKRY